MPSKQVTLSLLIVFCAGCANALIIKPTRLPEKLTERQVQSPEQWWTRHKVLLIDVHGMILNARKSSLWAAGDNPVDRFRQKLQLATKDGKVKAVVLRINSPGGTVTASEIMHRDLLHFRQETSKPVVACIMDTGASGAYYLAVGADQIMAHPSSLTGSIGVIMTAFSVEGLLNKIGVATETIKSGKRKDLGTPFRNMTPEERDLLQATIDEYHNQFVQAVAQGRPELDETTVRTLADGRVYTGKQAVEHKLVDRLGYLDDAIKLAKDLAGISDAKVVTYGRQWDHKATIYSQPPNQPTTFNLINVDRMTLRELTVPQFMYLWAPGW